MTKGNPPDWCNCQAVPGAPEYPGPWHPRGDQPYYSCSEQQDLVLTTRLLLAVDEYSTTMSGELPSDLALCKEAAEELVRLRAELVERDAHPGKVECPVQRCGAQFTGEHCGREVIEHYFSAHSWNNDERIDPAAENAKLRQKIQNLEEAVARMVRTEILAKLRRDYADLVAKAGTGSARDFGYRRAYGNIIHWIEHEYRGGA